MQASHLLLLGNEWDTAGQRPVSDGIAGLAAALQLSERDLAAAVAAALPTERNADPGTIVIPAPAGPATVAVCALPPAHRGPGAPSAAERFFEAGLRLGGASAGIGTIWFSGRVDDSSDAGKLIASLRDALWAGAWLATQQPAVALDEARKPLFGDGIAVSEAIELGVLARAWVRMLSERPANLLGPEQLGAEIVRLVHEMGRGIDVELWSAEEAGSRGFGAVNAVGGGSARPPYVAKLRWAGGVAAEAGAVLGVVGKGITFDTGGLNVKRDSGELAWMKSDMAAAATVAAALVLASRTSEAGAPVEVILPLCDNAVSGSSVRPGDVIAHPDGRTTEVVDTDCEGRLVIADGLAWLRKQGAAALIDMGTLTDGGAGLRRAGLWSNDAEFAAQLQRLGDDVADPLWAIPLPYGEDEVLESRVADAKNAPMDRPDVGRHAATFLAEFAGEVPWGHLDIGGVAYLESPIAGWPEGPTGAMTFAVAEAMRAWAAGSLR